MLVNVDKFFDYVMPDMYEARCVCLSLIKAQLGFNLGLSGMMLPTSEHELICSSRIERSFGF
jgi:hypothetical protein